MNRIPIESSVIIFDDHKMFSNTLSVFLERMQLFVRVHVANNEQEVVSLFSRLGNSERIYFFLDYQIGEKHSMHLLNEAKYITRKIKTIIISSVENPLIINSILAYSPSAIISKASGTEIITECLKKIESGKTYLCPVIEKYIENGKTKSITANVFSKRELEILQYFANGLSISETAEAVNLSKFTIINHRSNMMRKTGTKSIVDLLAYCRRYGLI